MSFDRQQNSLFPALLDFPRFMSRIPANWGEMLGDFKDLGFDQSGLSISEDKKSVFVEASLPGLNVDDIAVNLDKGILWIKGDKKEEEENKEKKYYRKASSSFSYRLALPGAIDESKEPKAIYKDGILKLTFVKAQQNQGKKIVVKPS